MAVRKITHAHGRSSHRIDLTHQSRHRNFSAHPIGEAIRAALTRHGCEKSSISVVIVDDEQMAILHRDHLDIEQTTDVLTFDLSGQADDIEGEIVLCADAAGREAKRRAHSLEAEIVLYGLHGALHLLGYDDLTPTDAAIMHEQEDQILHSLGWGRVYHSRGKHNGHVEKRFP